MTRTQATIKKNDPPPPYPPIPINKRTLEVGLLVCLVMATLFCAVVAWVVR